MYLVQVAEEENIWFYFEGAVQHNPWRVEECLHESFDSWWMELDT